MGFQAVKFAFRDLKNKRKSADRKVSEIFGKSYIYIYIHEICSNEFPGSVIRAEREASQFSVHDSYLSEYAKIIIISAQLSPSMLNEDNACLLETILFT